jgi:hypothetical protein
MDIIYKPYPQQELLHTCPYEEILLEGNRGGGKSDCFIMEYLKYVGVGYKENWAGIVFRKEIKELKELIKKSRKYVQNLCPEADFNKSERTWTFPDGETLTFQIAVNEEDYWSYHGQEYPFQAFDELTSWADPGFYLSMASCCRSTVPGIPKKRISTTNPWGAGHGWVKERFIDPAPRLSPITEVIDNPFNDIKVEMTRVTIHFDLAENTHLLENDPKYIAQLNQITNEAKRKAWIEGSWDIQVGAFFGDVFGKDNIIPAFEIPTEWIKFMSMDWGYAKPFSVGWWAVSDGTKYPKGALIRYREYYGCTDEPDTGLKLTIEEISANILSREHEKIDYRICDPSMWDASRGESLAERMGQHGLHCTAGDNKRQAGWELMRQYMKGKEIEPDVFAPELLVFENCVDFIKTIPDLLHDTKKLEDLDTTQEDHIADEARYGVMSRPYFNSRPKGDDVRNSNFWKIRDRNAEERY